MGQQLYKSGDDVTHLMNNAAPVKSGTYKSGDDVTHLMNQSKAAPVEQPMGDTYTGPDTFMEGVKNSGPEVLDAMGKGAMGYLKGATLDIPETIINAAKSAYHHPLDAALSTMGPLGDMLTGHDTMAPLRDASAHAGGEPEAFGRILGQVAGQPAVMAGMPSVSRMAGTPVAAAGRIMKNHQPLSGMIPGMFEPRLARILEAAAGRGVENMGEWMRKPPVPQGEIMPPDTPNVMEGDFNPIPNVSPVNTQRALPPSPTSFYGPGANPVPPMELPPMASHAQLPPSTTYYNGPSSIQQPQMLEGMPQQQGLPPSSMTFGEPSPIGGNYDRFGPSPESINQKDLWKLAISKHINPRDYMTLDDGSLNFESLIQAIESKEPQVGNWNIPNTKSVSAPTQAPKVRINSDGNFVDLSNGQTIDKAGKVISYSSKLGEILQKPFPDMSVDELELLSKQNLDKSVAKTVKNELAKRTIMSRSSAFFAKNH